MKCIIIEDQPPAQRILQKYISDYGSLELVGIFGDAVSAMVFLRESEVDFIFLDIHLPKLSGIDFLKSLTNPPLTILTTAYQEFALESYDLDVVDYLLKPFSFVRFIKAIHKMESKCSTNENAQAKEEIIFVKSGYDHIKVSVSDIQYLKGYGDYTEMYVLGKKILSSESLRHWIDRLPETLIRVHKSYVVNRSRVSKISSSELLIDSEIKVPVGRAHKDKVMELI